MTVHILAISTNHIAEELVSSAITIFAHEPEIPITAVSCTTEQNPDTIYKDLTEHFKKIQEQQPFDGLLILTDLYGATPSNIANKLELNCPIEVIAGMNLPMIIRILNYPKLGLLELKANAISGGIEGIISARKKVKKSRPSTTSQQQDKVL